MGRLLALYQDCAALARFFGSSSTKGQLNFLPLINGDEERVPQRKMNLTVKEQKNLPLKLTDNVLQSASYSFSDLTDRVAVLQHEWVWSALFMLCKHQNEFFERGDYDKIRNVTLCATNRSGKQIFALLNRLLLSHSNMRAPLIDSILKIRSLGDDFEQVHKLYASDSTWCTACQMLDACPSQSALSVHQYEHWLEHSQQRSRSSTGRHNQAHLDEGVEAIKAFLSFSSVMYLFL